MRRPRSLVVVTPSRAAAACVRARVPRARVIRVCASRRWTSEDGAFAFSGGVAVIDLWRHAAEAHGASADLVVASELTRPDAAPRATPSGPLLATALSRKGLDVHIAPVPVDGSPVAEAAFNLARPPHSPPTPIVFLGLPLPGTSCAVGRGLRCGMRARALRTLQRAAPIVDEWSRAIRSRRILLAAPRSFCAGVDRAIEIVELALEQRGAPVYVRRQIVHNEHVVAELERRGAVFVDELDEIPSGSTTVFSAHGVSPAIRSDAAERRLEVIDATCPLVSKVHAEARRFAAEGDTVFLIGHAGHEEIEGTSGEAPDATVLVESVSDARDVEPTDPTRVSYLTQTTLAVDETAAIIRVLKQRFPALRGPSSADICYATTNRQQAVREIARDADVVLVVGSQTSSNSLRLVEVAEREGTPAHLVDDETDVDLAWITDACTIGISAGASAPELLVERLIRSIAALGGVDVEELSVASESLRFKLPRAVRA